MSRMLWIGLGLLWIGASPLASQDMSQDAEEARAVELSQEVTDSTPATGDESLIDLWISVLQKSYGPNHPLILSTLHQAGMMFYKQGQYQESLYYFKKEAEISKKALGPEHPETLAALNNLAQLTTLLGDHQTALAIQKQVLQVGQRILGQEHPDILTARANLALTLFNLGELQIAKQEFEQVLRIRKHLLGHEHPDTLTDEVRLAATLRALGDLKHAKQLSEQILQVCQRTLGDEHPLTLYARSNLAEALQALGDLKGAKQQQEQLLQTRKIILGNEHPETLATEANLANTLFALGDLKEANKRIEQVFRASRHTLGDEHPQTLTAQINLAVTFKALGDLQRAKRQIEEVLQIRERLLGTEHPETLIANEHLAQTLYALGDLEGAQARLKQALQIRQHILGNEHPETLTTNQNLALVLSELGDLEEARQRQQKVLQIRKNALGQEHPETLIANANLAVTLRTLGDLKRAKRQQEQVLQISQRILGDEHPDTLTVNANLATTLLVLGDIQRARQQFEQILQIRKRILGDEHPDTLTVNANLAETLQALGDFQGAKQRQEKVLQIRKRILGDTHPDTLATNANLAGTLRLLGDLQGARQRYEQIMATRKLTRADYQPNTIQEANELFFLGATHQQLGDSKAAFLSFLAGLDALEAQTLRIDPAEDLKTQYIARYGNSYHDAITNGIDTDQVNLSFHVLERYRTQSLLSLIRWRHPEFGQDLPKNLRRDLATIARRYDWLTRERDRLYPHPAPDLLAEQAQLRRRREVIQGEIISIRRARGDLPSPLDTEVVQENLEPGTLMLAFSLGDETSHLFVLTSKELQAHPLHVKSSQIWEQLKNLTKEDLKGIEGSRDVRRRMSTWLYDKLLAPVAQEIENADRIVILPDGPLNYLHFAALTHPAPDDPRGWQYLAEWKPIHTVQSATVYAELIARRKDNPSQDNDHPVQWVGFGNPFYPKAEDVRLAESAASEDDPQLPEALRSTTERGIWGGLTPLPYTEREIEGIADLFPKDAAQPFLQHDANEDRARQILSEAPIVHFAAHGVADPDFPMDSFLALSLLEGEEGAQHNGLLQAWEIANDLHLDADLVVLSACVTALGPNRGGEGLISLSRAFQIAGARSVLASLWAVNDLSTSELMIRFYKYLRKGEAKDRALQLAQQEFIAGPIEVTLDDGTVVTKDFSAPYHWAAFQLIGDWR